MVRDSAKQYAQSNLAPRVKQLSMKRALIRIFFAKWGNTFLHHRWLRMPRGGLRLLRLDGTRD